MQVRTDPRQPRHRVQAQSHGECGGEAERPGTDRQDSDTGCVQSTLRRTMGEGGREAETAKEPHLVLSICLHCLSLDSEKPLVFSV